MNRKEPQVTLVENINDFHLFIKKEILPLIQNQTLFLLEGAVGVGKTELVKTVASERGLQGVRSPTFAFHQVYEGSRLRLHHLDLYRLKNEDELESVGFWDLFNDPDSVFFIEWPDLIQPEAWPWGWQKVRVLIEKVSDSSETRRISLQKDDSFPQGISESD
jgi:tRNA threonylcarbamoyladenosine biosynthesis protein TsaE